MLITSEHTCYKDDGGTPNRRCYACEAEEAEKDPIGPLKEVHSRMNEDKAAMAIDPNPPNVVLTHFPNEVTKALDAAQTEWIEAWSELKVDPSGRKVRHSSKFSEWGTPKEMYLKLDREFRFCLDAAASNANKKSLNYFGPDHSNPSFRDALKIDWYGSVVDSFGYPRAVFCNPPFSREEKIPLEPWIEKFWIESQKGLPVVSVIPASIQTKWWAEFVRKAHEIRAIPHRVAFEPPAGYLGNASGAGNNTAVVIWKPWTGYREPYEAVYRYWSYRAQVARDSRRPRKRGQSQQDS